ncbi:MAG: diheme cytochrome c [Thermodesulfobacteriota bacterium]
MKAQNIIIALAIIAVVVGVILIGDLLERRGDTKYARVFLPPVDNALYEAECGSCHFLYLPGLLPVGSWTRLIDGSDEHFGHALGLDAGVKEKLGAYLAANAAETTGAKRSGRILDSLAGATPLRITETPYIKRKHQWIKAIVYERESIRSFSNCIACHTTAAEGNFREANVVTPK